MKIQLSELRKIIRNTLKEAGYLGVASPSSGLPGPMMTGGGAEQPSASELSKFSFILGNVLDAYEEQKRYNPRVKFANTLDTELKTEKALAQKMKNYISSAEDPEGLFQDVPGMQKYMSDLLSWASNTQAQSSPAKTSNDDKFDW